MSDEEWPQCTDCGRPSRQFIYGHPGKAPVCPECRRRTEHREQRIRGNADFFEGQLYIQLELRNEIDKLNSRIHFFWVGLTILLTIIFFMMF